MTYRQDLVERICQICQKPIEKDQWMLDLFRQESSQPGASMRVCWVHADCARSAIETWLRRKWDKTKEAADERPG